MKRTLFVEQPTSATNKRPRLQVPKAPYYDFEPLILKEEHLRKYAKRNRNSKWVIDFASRDATLALTRAILKHHFQLTLTLPPQHLVPTIPNRVQYLLWAAALIGSDAPNNNQLVLDIGTGPSCIYPMLGSRLFPKWSFVATDTDPQAVTSARQNCSANSLSNVEVITTESTSFFPQIVLKGKPRLSVCNPPFHEDLPVKHNQAGTESQLKTDGGEFAFLRKMALESRAASEILWFTSLIGRKIDKPKIVSFLRSKEVRAPLVTSAEFSQGGRTTRWAVAWSFGEMTSIARILTDSSSTWRCAIQVQPGRKYANHLECRDIVDLTCAACHTLGWQRLADPDRTANPYEAILALLGEEGQSSGELFVDCLPKRPTGDFEVLLKINRKGTFPADFVQSLGESVCAKISIILNEPIS